MNKKFESFGVGYAILAAWTPLMWTIFTVAPDDLSLLSGTFAIIFAGSAMTAVSVLNNLQVDLEGTKTLLKYCREEYIEERRSGSICCNVS